MHSTGINKYGVFIIKGFGWPKACSSPITPENRESCVLEQDFDHPPLFKSMDYGRHDDAVIWTLKSFKGALPKDIFGKQLSNILKGLEFQRIARGV